MLHLQGKPSSPGVSFPPVSGVALEFWGLEAAHTAGPCCRDWIRPGVPQTLRGSDPGASLGKPWTAATERPCNESGGSSSLKARGSQAPPQPGTALSVHLCPWYTSTPRAFLFSPKLVEVQNHLQDRTYLWGFL